MFNLLICQTCKSKFAGFSVLQLCISFTVSCIDSYASQYKIVCLRKEDIFLFYSIAYAVVDWMSQGSVCYQLWIGQSTAKLEMLIYWAPVSQCSSPLPLSLEGFLLADSLAVTKFISLSLTFFYLSVSFAIFLSTNFSLSPSHPRLFAQSFLSSLPLCLSQSNKFSVLTDHGLTPRTLFVFLAPSLLVKKNRPCRYWTGKK